MAGFQSLIELNSVGVISRDGVLFSGNNKIRYHDGKRGKSSVARARVGNINIARVMSTGHDVSVSDGNTITVLAPQKGTILCEVGDIDYRAGAHEALILSPSKRHTRVMAPSTGFFEAVPVLFSMCDIKRAVEESGGAASTRRRLENFTLNASACKSSTGSQFLRLLNLLVEDLDSAAQPISKKAEQSWSQLLTEKLVDMLNTSEVVELPNPQKHGTSHGHVLRAEDFMQANFADITTVADVAHACGTSIRTLEMAFQAVRSLTPTARLSEIRMNEARRLLSDRCGSESVSVTAFECGFTHLGRFSMAYKKQFGESPSETLHRR